MAADQPSSQDSADPDGGHSARDAHDRQADGEPHGRDSAPRQRPRPAEARTREEYADNMRAQGAPIPDEDDSSADDSGYSPERTWNSRDAPHAGCEVADREISGGERPVELTETPGPTADREISGGERPVELTEVPEPTAEARDVDVQCKLDSDQGASQRSRDEATLPGDERAPEEPGHIAGREHPSDAHEPEIGRISVPCDPRMHRTDQASDANPSEQRDDDDGQPELSDRQPAEHQRSADHETNREAAVREGQDPTEASTLGGDPPEGNRPPDRPFLDVLEGLEEWLENERIPYAILGSLAVSAYVDHGRSLDFDRPSAYDQTQRRPDIDLLIPRDCVPRVQSYSDSLLHSDFPVKLETVDGYIDYRPNAEQSYLTHRQLRFPVPSVLFEPRKASFLGQEITTVDPRTLLHLFGTIGGVIRKKDVPKITGLADAIASGKAVSRFNEQDCAVFSRYMAARKRQYPAFIAAKRTWEGVLDVLPPKAGGMLKHHLLPAAQQAIRYLNRDTGTRDRERER